MPLRRQALPALILLLRRGIKGPAGNVRGSSTSTIRRRGSWSSRRAGTLRRRIGCLKDHGVSHLGVGREPGLRGFIRPYRGRSLGVSQRLPSGRVTLSFSVRQEEFFDLLRNAPHVETVDWDTSKASQGNVGQHHMDQNVKVWVPGFASSPLVFELTRN